jgi:hypothetical protein
MAEPQSVSNGEPRGVDVATRRGLDLDDRVRLGRPAGGFPAGSEGTVIDVWCAGRCLVELGPFDAPVVVEVEAADVEPMD